MPAITYTDLFDAFYSTHIGSSWIDICQVDDDRWVIVFIDYADNFYVKAVVAVVSGNEIYFGAVKTIVSVKSIYTSCCRFSENATLPRALICWVDDSGGANNGKGYAEWVEVAADNSITLKTATVFEDIAADPADLCKAMTCCMLDEDRAAIFYGYLDDSGSDYELHGVTVDRNANALTIGTEKVLEGSDCYIYAESRFHAFQVDRDLAFIMWYDTGSGWGKINYAVFSDDKLIRESNSNTWDSGMFPRGCKLAYNKILITGLDADDNNYPHVKVGDLNWTYDADEMADGDMDAAAVANWTATTATLSSETGGQSGNCMKLLENGGANPTAHWDWVAAQNAKSYEVTFYVKAGDEATYEAEIYDVNTAATICKIKENEATTEWTRQRFFFNAINLVNNTRIILRQICANGASTYILFDSIVIKPIASYTLTFGTSYKVNEITAYSTSICALDSTHALLLTYRSKVIALTISGSAIEITESIDTPADDTIYPKALIVSQSGDNYKIISAGYDSTVDLVRALLFQWQSLPTAKAYLGIGGSSDKLRLVETGDADYSTLRMCANITSGTPILNGEFEDWTAGDADHFTDSANAVSDEETADPYSGSSSLKLTASGAAQQYTQSDNVTVTAAKDYWLKFRYKNTVGDTAQYLVYDVTNVANIIAVTDLADSTAWSDEQSVKVTTPAGCVSIYVRLYAKADGDVVFWDNVYLNTVLAADLVEDNPPFNVCPVRIKDATDIRLWRDSSSQ